MPEESAQLEVKATDKGILIPQVALSDKKDRTTISKGNVESLMVFNTSSNAALKPGYYYWYDGEWRRLINDNDMPAGMQRNKVVSVDRNYPIKGSERVILGDAGAGDILLSLPPPEDHRGKIFTVKKEDDNEDHYVKVKGKIQGISREKTLYTAIPSTGWDFISDGTEWKIVNKF